MGNIDKLQWLALGFALASPVVQKRMASDLPTESFDFGSARELFAALGHGRSAVVKAIGNLGVTVREGERVYEAVLAAVKEYGGRRLRKEVLDRLADAIRLLPAEKFEELVRTELAKLVPEKPKVAQDRVA